MTQPTADVGLIGLGVMGRNLGLNLDDHGLTVVGFDRDAAQRDAFLAEAGGRSLRGAASPLDLVASLRRPRRILLLVPAGPPVDEAIAALLPGLEPGDIIIDGGNSHYGDTAGRAERLESLGLLFVGLGISGGAAGARSGPSLMAGGSPAARPQVEDWLQAIAARTPDGEPCYSWLGAGGAGHYVKMVHNGIEYGAMQLLAEAYHLLRDGAGLSNNEMRSVFADWAGGELGSYLVEITRDILARVDGKGRHVLDSILDVAGQKGTGQWAVQSAADLGVPATLAAEAVFARALSARLDERRAAAATLPGPAVALPSDRAALVADLQSAVRAAAIVGHAQGFMLLHGGAQEHGWSFDYRAISRTWRGGCIIRSLLLGEIEAAYARRGDLPTILLDDSFRAVLGDCQGGWRRTAVRAAERGLPVPAISSALAFYDGYRCARLPAGLLQAQRDYFGSHTYERVDRPRGETFHTDWAASPGEASPTG